MSTYRKLGGKGRVFSAYSQAWLGSDHLLIVNSSNYVERYQHFAFADIQSIVVSEGGIYWTALVSGACALGALALIRLAWPSDARYFFGAVALLFLAIAAVDLLRGRRCRCVVQTAVSRERVRAIFRLRAARKLIAALTPLIESVQGAMPVEDLAQAAALAPEPGSEQLFPVSPAASQLQLTDVPAAIPPAIPRPRGYWCELLFGILILDSVVDWAALHSGVWTALTFLVTIYFAEALLGIVALVKSLSRISISTGFVIVTLLCLTADLTTLALPAAWHTLVNALVQAQQQPMTMEPALQMTSRVVILSVGWRIAVGVIGLAVALVERRRGNP